MVPSTPRKRGPPSGLRIRVDSDASTSSLLPTTGSRPSLVLDSSPATLSAAPGTASTPSSPPAVDQVTIQTNDAPTLVAQPSEQVPLPCHDPPPKPAKEVTGATRQMSAEPTDTTSTRAAPLVPILLPPVSSVSEPAQPTAGPSVLPELPSLTSASPFLLHPSTEPGEDHAKTPALALPPFAAELPPIALVGTPLPSSSPNTAPLGAPAPSALVAPSAAPAHGLNPNALPSGVPPRPYSPPRSPLPADTPAPQLPHSRPPNAKDALSYLEMINVKFQDKPDVYDHFLDILRDFKSQAIDTPGVIDRVLSLFNGHTALIQGFNNFLPQGYRIDCTVDQHDHNLITVTTPSGTTTQTTGGPLRHVLSAHTSPAPYPVPAHGALGGGPLPPLSPFYGIPLEAVHAVVALHGDPPLIPGATPAVPGPSTTPGPPALPDAANAKGPAMVEFNQAVNYVNKVKKRFASDPDTYNQFIGILQTYRDEQSPVVEVYQQINVLFNDHRDLLEDFRQFLPDDGAAGAGGASGAGISVGAGPLFGTMDQMQAGAGLSRVDGKSFKGKDPTRGFPSKPSASADKGKRKDAEDRETSPAVVCASTFSLRTHSTLSFDQVAEEIESVPGVGRLAECLGRVFQVVENSRVNSNQWKLLQGRCVMVTRIAVEQITKRGGFDFSRLEDATNLLRETFNAIITQAHFYNEMEQGIEFFQFELISEEIKRLFGVLDSCLTTLFAYEVGVAQSQWIDEFRRVQEQELTSLNLIRQVFLNKNKDTKRNAVDQAQSAKKRAENIRSKGMSAREMFECLLRHGCHDLTGKVDLKTISEHAVATGAYGDIWKGKLDDSTDIAIKVWGFRRADEAPQKCLKGAMRELYNWSKANHQNVQKLLGVVMFKERLGMVSEWMGNGNLQDYVRRHESVDRYHLCIEAAKAVQYLHQEGMVHGDLKASNCLVSSDGVIKLTDFDHSIISCHSLVFSQTTTMGGGTMRWMAPELIMDEGEVELRSTQADVYALGMTMLEIISGTLPYLECQTDAQIYYKLLGKVLPEQTVHFQDARGKLLWELLVQCWDHDPALRPSADQVVDHLQLLSHRTLPSGNDALKDGTQLGSK